MEFLSRQIAVPAAVLISFTLIACSGGGSGVDSNHSPFYAPAASFDEHFDFGTTSDYQVTDGVTIASGIAKISPSQAPALNDVLSADANLALSSTSVRMTSGNNATLVSKPIDGLNTSMPWTKIRFNTSNPFGKEIAASAESGYGTAVTDHSSQMLGLWHLNETGWNGTTAEIKDSSGQGVHAHAVNGASSTISGKFGGGGSVAGGSQYIQLESAFPVTTNTLTITAWVKGTVGTAYAAILFGRGGFAATGLNYNATNSNIGYHWGDQYYDWDSGLRIPDNVWTFVAITVSPSAAVIYRGANGALSSNTNNAGHGAINFSTDVFHIGQDLCCGGRAMNGVIDEVGVWNRTMSSSEIRELYLRGANRLNLQVRACDSLSTGDCAGAPAWTGLDGTSATYFNELANIANPYAQTGAIGTTPYATLWSSLASLNAGFSTWWNANKLKRYLQYKAIFESDDTTSFPDLSTVAFEPTTRYAIAATVETLRAKPFSKISSVSFTSAACGLGLLKFELSNGSSWLSWNGTAWIASSSNSTAMTGATLQSLTSTQWDLFPKGLGTIAVRAYLGSDGTSACEIDDVRVQGTL